MTDTGEKNSSKLDNSDVLADVIYGPEVFKRYRKYVAACMARAEEPATVSVWLQQQPKPGGSHA